MKKLRLPQWKIDKLFELIDTTLMSHKEIGLFIGMSRAAITIYLKANYTEADCAARATKVRAARQCGPSVHNQVGKYKRIQSPDWYTGYRSATNSVYEHHTVLLKHLGLTELPEGCVCHHCDDDKGNNDISNLVLMTRGNHCALHKTKGTV